VLLDLGLEPSEALVHRAVLLDPPDVRKRRRGESATASLLETAERLGLVGPLGDDPADLDCAGRGNTAARRLEEGLLSDAALALDTPRLATAFVWFERFERETQRTAFRAADTVVGQRWNRRSIDMFTRFITTSAPIGRTKLGRVTQGVASSYSGAVYRFRCMQAGFDVAPTEGSLIAGLLAKTTKRAEPPAGARVFSQGLRATAFAAAAAAGFDRTSASGEVRWAAGLTAHNLLLRGGEVGESDDAHPEPHRVLRGRSIHWRDAANASRRRLWLLVWVIPIKDPKCVHRGYPCPVARRHDGRLGADPLCTYDALALMWWRRIGRGQPFPVDAHGAPAAGWWLQGSLDPAVLSAPLFPQPDGTMWRTSTSRALFRDIAAAAGLDPAPFGAKAGRIGGATDARERSGEAGKDVVQRRGRWASDVAEVYQRELLGVQLDLSAAMGDAVGEDLEQLCLGWVQPAR
jgi:hypothetical protein